MIWKQLFLTATLVLCLTVIEAWASVSVTLYDGTTPTGDLSGSPGQTVGWGVTVQNFETYWLQVNYTDYFPGSGYGQIGGPPPPYNDNLGPAYVTIAPTGTTPDPTYYVGSYTDYYVPATQSGGAGSYAIGLVAAGSKTIGTIGVNYNLYSINPLTYVGNPGGIIVAENQTASAPASVTAAVPEPSTYALLCIGLGVVGYARRRMVKKVA